MLKKIALISLIGLVGCATNTITGRSQLMLVPESFVVDASARAYDSEINKQRNNGNVETNPRIVAHVNIIAQRIISQAVKVRPETEKWQWQVTVIKDPQVNAFAMAGGKIAVYTGLLQKLNPTDDELAQVLAHEVGHALAAHSQEKMSVSLGTDLALTLFAATRKPDQRTQAALAVAAMLAIELPNSREMESEADRIGLELAAKAGYHPEAALSLWQKMSKLKEFKMPEFLSTHPSDDSRLEALKQLVPQMMPYYEQAPKI